MKSVGYFLLVIGCLLVWSCSPKEVLETVVPPVLKYTEIAPGKVAFTVTGSNISGYKWDYGDNLGTSTEATPIYQYRFNGDYKVTLIVQQTANNRTSAVTLTEKITIWGMKTSTPSFVLTLDANNRTVLVKNPSEFVRKVDWEFIDVYEGTTKQTGSEVQHTFPWNVEHTIKMTATVGSRNGDTTYTDTQKVRITGNPKVSLKNISYYLPTVPNPSNVLNFTVDQRIQKVEVTSLDKEFRKISYDLGKLNSKANAQVMCSLYEPLKEYRVRVAVTNPNGTTEVDLTPIGWAFFWPYLPEQTIGYTESPFAHPRTTAFRWYREVSGVPADNVSFVGNTILGDFGFGLGTGIMKIGSAREIKLNATLPKITSYASVELVPSIPSVSLPAFLIIRKAIVSGKFYLTPEPIDDTFTPFIYMPRGLVTFKNGKFDYTSLFTKRVNIEGFNYENMGIEIPETEYTRLVNLRTSNPTQFTKEVIDTFQLKIFGNTTTYYTNNYLNGAGNSSSLSFDN
jgi:hypothetical protein